MDVDYLVEALWHGPLTGLYSDDYCNLTADVLDLEVVRGRDYASQLLGKASAGKLRANLRNEDDLYSTSGAGPLAGLLNPGVLLQVSGGLVEEQQAAHIVAADARYLLGDGGIAWGDSTGFMVAWVKLDSLPTAGNTMAICGQWQAGNLEFLLFVENVAGTVRFKFSVRDTANTTTTTVTATTFGTPATGTWYMLTAYHDAAANAIGIGVNLGAYDTAATAGGVRDGGGNFTVGQHTGGNYLNGYVATVIVHEAHSLTAAERTWLYNSGAARNESAAGVEDTDGAGLIDTIWFPLGETSGTRYSALGAALLETGGAIGSSAGLTHRIYKALWAGAIDTLLPDIDQHHFKSAMLNGSGFLSQLAAVHDFNGSPALTMGVDYTGNWVYRILIAAVGWVYVVFDAGLTLTGIFFAETENALELVRQMEDTELGFFSEMPAPSGGQDALIDYNRFWTTTAPYMFEFCDRQARLTRERSTVPQAVFSDSPGAGELSYLTIKQDDPLKDIYNQVQVDVSPLLPGGQSPVPTKHGSATGTGLAVSSKTLAGYVVGTNDSRLLRVTAFSSDGAGDQPTGVTYGGVPLTLLKAADRGSSRVSVWYLLAPVSGAADIVVTWPDAQARVIVAAEDWYYVDQDNPWGSVAVRDLYVTTGGGAGGTLSLAVSSANGEVVVSSACCDDIDLSVTGVEVLLWFLNDTLVSLGALSANGKSPSQTVSWKVPLACNVVVIACSLRPDMTVEVASDVPIWTLQGGETPTIAPGESKTFTASYPNMASGSESGAFVSAWVTPVVGTDIVAADGGAAAAKLTVATFKKSNQMLITITNTDLKKSVTLTTIAARGVVYTHAEPARITVQDDDSIGAYGLRSYKLPAMWLADTDQARDFANYVLSRYKDPNHRVTLTFMASKDADSMHAALWLNIGDRVTVVADGNAGLGLNEDFYIESISHHIDQGKTRHEVTYELSAVAGDGVYWVLGTGELGTTTKLGY